jgi:hypothetical protein
MREKLRKERLMKIRKDSPFFGIKDHERKLLVIMASCGKTHHEIASKWNELSGKMTGPDQVHRFLARCAYEEELKGMEGQSEELAVFGERAADGKARDGIIEAGRQRLFERALASGNDELLLELYREANEERGRERELAVSQRKAAVAEENARIGRERLALKRSVAERMLDQQGPRKKLVQAEVVSSTEIAADGGETGAVLPLLRQVLLEEGRSAEEVVARVRELVLMGEARLLENAGH